ncbi:MAG: hypothetical protein ABSB58_01560 [Gemmatimonadales bacterium]|jgi:hypothetical protein
MVAGFLLSILGSAAYDTAKQVAAGLFGDRGDDKVALVYEALDAAAKQFFDRYGNAFGAPAESFLARQVNWNAVVRSIYYSSPPIGPTAFDVHGYGESPPASEEAVAFLVKVIEQEMRRHWELDKVLTEKDSIRKLDHVAEIIQSLTGKSPPDSRLDVRDPDRAPGWVPERNKLYTTTLGNGATIRYVLKDDGVNVEYVFPDGAVAYYDVDNAGSLRNYKSPYPLEEYRVVVDPSMVIRTEEQELRDGLKRIVLHLKWGRRVETVVDRDGRLKHVQINEGGAHVDHQKRLFVVLPPKSGD